MSVGYLMWVIAIAIAVLVGLAKFAGVSVPVATPMLMKDSTLSLFIALALALASKWVR